MNPDDIARYLAANPGFFENYGDVLAGIQVPSPHGGKTISLADRQVLTLREKIRALEAKLGELIQFGEENDTLSERVHRLATALLAARELDATIAALYASLREDFSVPHVAMRFFRGSGPQAEFEPTSERLRDYASTLAHPFCGPNQHFEAGAWFSVGIGHIRSLACIALKDGSTTFGLIALGSEDARRFYPEMGTLYLGRIGELASVALARHV